MLELILSGGWLMLPIILSSIIAMAIIIERLWTLRIHRVAPPKTILQVKSWLKNKQLNAEKIAILRKNSPLGSILVTGLINRQIEKNVLKELINEQASIVIHNLERYLNTLGTIAAIAPLLGLLGTVIGMIDVFSVITEKGAGNTGLLAGGISKALITTAAGLTIAIFSLFFHRYFTRKIDEIILLLEKDVNQLLGIFFTRPKNPNIDEIIS